MDDLLMNLFGVERGTELATACRQEKISELQQLHSLSTDQLKYVGFKLGEVIKLPPSSNESGSATEKRVQELITKLKDRHKDKQRVSSAKVIKDKPTRSIKDQTQRKIQVGWLNSKDGMTYTQVRLKDGGGTRDLLVDLGEVTPDILLRKMCSIFIQENQNMFTCKIGNFKGNAVIDFKDINNKPCSLLQYMQSHGLYPSKCRMYLMTSPVNVVSMDVSHNKTEATDQTYQCKQPPHQDDTNTSIKQVVNLVPPVVCVHQSKKQKVMVIENPNDCSTSTLLSLNPEFVSIGLNEHSPFTSFNADPIYTPTAQSVCPQSFGLNTVYKPGHPTEYPLSSTIGPNPNQRYCHTTDYPPSTSFSTNLKYTSSNKCYEFPTSTDVQPIHERKPSKQADCSHHFEPILTKDRENIISHNSEPFRITDREKIISHHSEPIFTTDGDNHICQHSEPILNANPAIRHSEIIHTSAKSHFIVTESYQSTAIQNTRTLTHPRPPSPTQTCPIPEYICSNPHIRLPSTSSPRVESNIQEPRCHDQVLSLVGVAKNQTISVSYVRYIDSVYDPDIVLRHVCFSPRQCYELSESCHDVDYADYNPLTDGYTIRSITINDRLYLDQIRKDENKAVDYILPQNRSTTNSSSLIVHQPNEICGYLEYEVVIGVVISGDISKSEFTWYRDDEETTSGSGLCCVPIHSTGVYHVSVKQNNTVCISESVIVRKVEEYINTALPLVQDKDLIYAECDLIGHGSFGSVYRGKWMGTDVAIKKIKLKRQTKTVQTALKREIDILSRLRHPNIVQVLGTCSKAQLAYLVLELVDGEDLETIIFDNNSIFKLKPEEKTFVAIQIVKAVTYLHNITPPVIHRDLKPANVLVTKTSLVTKLCNLGLSKIRKTQTSVMNIGAAGTPTYMAPEAILADPEETSYRICGLWGALCWNSSQKRNVGRTRRTGTLIS